MNIQVIRKIVTLRTILNRIMRTPQRFETIELKPIVAVTNYQVTDKNNKPFIQSYTHTLNGKLYTRIETYKNKQTVQVVANINSRYLRPI